MSDPGRLGAPVEPAPHVPAPQARGVRFFDVPLGCGHVRRMLDGDGGVRLAHEAAAVLAGRWRSRTCRLMVVMFPPLGSGAWSPRPAR